LFGEHGINDSVGFPWHVCNDEAEPLMSEISVGSREEKVRCVVAELMILNHAQSTHFLLGGAGMMKMVSFFFFSDC
jgi:hypothetical protein